MSSIIKVDQIQLADGSTPTAGDLGVTLGSADLPTGSVLQVVTQSHSSFVIINNTTFTDTNLSATITPSSTSSIIQIIVSQAILVSRDTSDVINSACRILDGDDSVIATADRLTGTSSGTSTFNVIRANDTAILTATHTPNTTSAITYRTQIKPSTTSNNGLVVAQDGNSRSSIILMEIAG